MESSSTAPPPTSSTITSSSDAISNPPQQNLHVLEISLISAQDLPQVTKSMRTYAVLWIHPRRKLTSCTDQKGHTSPTWNDRFAFHVNNEFLVSENAAVTIEIYTTSSWFKDVLVGTVRVLISDLITPSTMNNPRFVALQIRLPSGKFQGKLNMGVTLMDGSGGSNPPFSEINPPNGDNLQRIDAEDHEKIHLWRSYSLSQDGVIEEFPEKGGSVCNGSMVNGSMCNGSELCSDVGPSASIVAAEIARQSILPLPAVVGRAKGRPTKEVDDFGSSIVEEMTMEEATAKGLRTNVARWRKEVSFRPMYDEDYDQFMERKSRRGHLRGRHSDGGLFSCFVCGFEFTIVCGASNKPNFKDSTRYEKKRPSSSESDST